MSNKCSIILIFALTLSASHAKPATNDQLDKATVNDVAANAVVTPDKKPDELVAASSSDEKKDGANTANVHISGITTGLEAGSTTPVEANPGAPFKPQRAGTMFARFIDDIFQIPINVLQNVAKLITSPFISTKKDPSASAP